MSQLETQYGGDDMNEAIRAEIVVLISEGYIDTAEAEQILARIDDAGTIRNEENSTS